MVSTFSPNLNLELVGRGDQVGVWDTPENSDWSVLDLVGGGITTVSGAAGSVVLAAAQFRAKTITINSTLLANMSLTFPTSFTKSYEVRNICTGSSQFVVTLTTSVAGGQVICCPPGESIDVVNDGTNLYFHNLGRIGTYWDFIGSSIPAWVSGCTVPPYLNCDGTAFSSATYPVLAGILGTTLPDTRARTRFTAAQGTTRLTSAVCGFSPTTVGAAGGDQNLQQHSHANTLNDPSHVHGGIPLPAGAGGGGGLPTVNGTQNTAAAFTGMTITNANAGTGTAGNIPPAYIGGLTLIRAG